MADGDPMRVIVTAAVHRVRPANTRQMLVFAPSETSAIAARITNNGPD
jgi:hypothetical protein